MKSYAFTGNCPGWNEVKQGIVPPETGALVIHKYLGDTWQSRSDIRGNHSVGWFASDTPGEVGRALVGWELDRGAKRIFIYRERWEVIADGFDRSKGDGNVGNYLVRPRRKLPGEPCLVNLRCLSGFCVDGVCCNNACDKVCERCDLSGSMGTCTPISDGEDPDDECPQVCDGSGACRGLPNGQPCENTLDCISEYCVDSVCCDNPCDGTCEHCNLLDTVGTCTLIPDDEDPEDECLDDEVCDGLGECYLPVPEPPLAVTLFFGILGMVALNYRKVLSELVISFVDNDPTEEGYRILSVDKIGNKSLLSKVVQ